MQLIKALILALALVAAVIVYRVSWVPTEHYFAQVHISEHEKSGYVKAVLVFPRPASDLAFPNGLGHYAEHIVALSSIVLDTSALPHANAWTGHKSIGYWIQGSENELASIIKKLSTVLEPNWIDAEYALEEVDIVLREYELRSMDNVDRVAYIDMLRFLYEGNDMGARAGQAPEDIVKFDFEAAVQYYDATHFQHSAVLLVQGDVSEREVYSAIKAAGIKPLEIEPDSQLAPFKLASHSSKTISVRDWHAEPRLIYSKIVALDEPVEFDLLELQARQLSAILTSNLPGGLAGPLRYDEFIARTFNLTIQPLDEQHVELVFEATLDSDVSFATLQSTLSSALASGNIPQSTYERIAKRSNQYWPDWDDDGNVAQWMATYAFRRASDLRTPVSKKALEKISTHVSFDNVTALHTALQQPGREATALIGNKQGGSE